MVQNLPTAISTVGIAVLACHDLLWVFFRVHYLSKITTFHIVVGCDLFKRSKSNMNDCARQEATHIACI